MTEDERHLRWLSIAHYVLAAVYTLFNLLVFGLMGFSAWMTTRPGTFPRRGSGNPSPDMFAGMVVGIFAFALLWSLAVVVCMFLAARYLAKRRHFVFCFVVAAIDCIWFPFGTVLGVFTIIVLSRPSVKMLFEQTPPASPDGSGLAAA